MSESTINVTEKINTFKKDIIQHYPKNDSFLYRLLSRMQYDCNYYLGNGERCEKYLWGETVELHLAYMELLWDNFSSTEKPEWLTKEELEDYKRKMILE